MMRLLQKLMPRRIGSQIAVLIVVSLLLATVVTAAVFLLRPASNESNRLAKPPQLAMTAKLLDTADTPEARADILRIARQGLPDLAELDLPISGHIKGPDDRLMRELQADLGSRFAVFAVPPEGAHSEGPRIAIRLPNGTVYAAQLVPQPERKAVAIGLLIFLIIVLTSVFLWAARVLTAPLRRFADAAERFSVDKSDAPLTESGPTEIRRLANALNGMRERIRGMVEDRMRMLAAVGHDLRTPITRLRLRAEDIENDLLRRQVIRDLDMMQHMVQSALSFLREEAVGACQLARTDLPSVVQALCDDFSDMGREFSLTCPRHLYVDCDPDQITRALANLVDNGLKFGSAVSVRVTDGGREVFIDVEDDGPGIAAADKSRVTEPFYRGDAARGLGEHGGFGLGLSIVHSIVGAHHGRLELRDAAPQGLLARLVIPKTTWSSSDGPGTKARLRASAD
jgi:signal transduction histidine kinase